MLFGFLNIDSLPVFFVNLFDPFCCVKSNKSNSKNDGGEISSSVVFVSPNGIYHAASTCYAETTSLSNATDKQLFSAFLIHLKTSIDSLVSNRPKGSQPRKFIGGVSPHEARHHSGDNSPGGSRQSSITAGSGHHSGDNSPDG